MPLSITAFISPGGTELLLVMLVLIMLFGAKDAPRILRTIQTLLDKMQRAAADFRYKIMFGDLHQGTTPDDPYDVEVDYPDETEECSESEVQSSPPEDSEQNPDRTEKKPLNSEPENSELDT